MILLVCAGVVIAGLVAFVAVGILRARLKSSRDLLTSWRDDK